MAIHSSILPGAYYEQRSLWTTLHGITESWTRLKSLCMLTHAYEQKVDYWLSGVRGNNLSNSGRLMGMGFLFW